MKTRILLTALVTLLASALLAGCGKGEESASSPTPEPTASSSLGKIAYALGGSIYVKSLPDGEPRKVAEGTGPRWSASGDWLLFERDGVLWEVREDGSGERQLPEGTVWSPKEDGGLSPDGTRRAYVEEVKDASSPFGRYHRLHVADAGGGDDRVLYESRDAGIILENWTADSRYVLFWDDVQFSASLMADGTTLEAIPASGGEPRPPYQGLTRPGMVSPAPTGATLAVTEGSGRESWTGKRIALVDVDSGEVTELTPTDMASLEPSWSPDGGRIAFVSQPDNKEGLASGKIPELTRDRRIWVMNSDGSNQHPLTDDPAYRDERPLWSADGSQILFARLDEDMQASLWLMPSDGGQARQVVEALGPTAGLDYYGAIDLGGLFDWWQPSTSAQATPEPTAEPTATPASPPVRHTGIAGVDAVIDAVLSGDPESIRPLVKFTSIACGANPRGLGGPPLCRPGEADATVVEAFPIGSCEGHYLRPDQMEGLLNSLTIEQLSLYAVYVPKPESWLTGDYVAVFSRPVSGVGVMAEEVFTTDGRIVGVGDGCGIGPELTFQDGEFDEVVLPPP